jgi:hypothetical protein
MREWISSQRYRAILFKRQNEFVAYALYEECEELTPAPGRPGRGPARSSGCP